MFKRLTKECAMLQKDNNNDIAAYPTNDSLMAWNVYIRGPENTPYAGGLYECNITISENYPLNPPKFKFKTKIFHPNISVDGDVCIDILKNQWSPVLNIGNIMVSICSLLSDPNANSPLNGSAGDMYLRSKDDYNKIASDMRDEFAMKTVVNRGIFESSSDASQ